jgi:predicted PurR-regulated permease PerM
LFFIVQILEAYVFPFAVGSRLKINTLVIIIMITAGGFVGAAGILFIPFASIAKLIADRTERILLGDGERQRQSDNVIYRGPIIALN